MKNSRTIVAAATAVMVAGLSGCSSNNATETTPAPSTHIAVDGAEGGAKVLIDGEDQNVSGTTVCTTAGSDVTIAVGGAATGIGVVLTDANPPVVKSVGLGNVNGVTLGYAAGTGQGDAKATKDGDGYKVTGTATGLDMTNPTQPVNKTFEIDVSCS